MKEKTVINHIMMAFKGDFDAANLFFDTGLAAKTHLRASLNIVCAYQSDKHSQLCKKLDNFIFDKVKCHSNQLVTLLRSDIAMNFNDSFYFQVFLHYYQKLDEKALYQAACYHVGFANWLLNASKRLIKQNIQFDWMVPLRFLVENQPIPHIKAALERNKLTCFDLLCSTQASLTGFLYSPLGALLLPQEQLLIFIFQASNGLSIEHAKPHLEKIADIPGKDWQYEFIQILLCHDFFKSLIPTEARATRFEQIKSHSFITDCAAITCKEDTIAMQSKLLKSIVHVLASKENDSSDLVFGTLINTFPKQIPIPAEVPSAVNDAINKAPERHVTFNLR